MLQIVDSLARKTWTMNKKNHIQLVGLGHALSIHLHQSTTVHDGTVEQTPALRSNEMFRYGTSCAFFCGV